MGLLTDITNYAQAIVDGKIVACVKHKQACQRWLTDISRQGTDGFQWVFNEEQANRFKTFAEKMKHRKGELAGQPKVLCDYELFVYCGNLYGWWDKEGKVRRFRQSYQQISRKSGKSQMLAIASLYEISLMGEPSPEGYIAATKKAQCQWVFDEAVWLINNCGLSKYFTYKHSDRFQTKVITHIKSGGVFSRLSKDDRRSGGDGGNPNAVVIDEFHQHPTSEYVDLMISGFGTRKNPLLNIITTAGFNLSYPCYRVEYALVTKMLKPENHTNPAFERYFSIVCELDKNETTETITIDGREIPAGGLIDELGTETAILKSNPVTGYLPVVQKDIIEKTQQAIQSREKMRNLLTKHYNVWVQDVGSHGFLDMSKWSACAVTPEELQRLIKEKAEGRCYVGIDLSTKIDLTSTVFTFIWKDENNNHCYAVKQHSFIPSEKFTERMATDKMPYNVWRDAGHLTVTDGAVVNYQQVVQYILDTVAENKWQDIEYCLDPWGAAAVSNMLQDAGKTVVEIGQTLKNLSGPTKELREAVYAKRLFHDGDPLLNWCMSNAIVRADHNENIMIDKAKSTNRIDPVAAIITGMARAMLDDTKTDTWCGIMAL